MESENVTMQQLCLMERTVARVALVIFLVRKMSRWKMARMPLGAMFGKVIGAAEPLAAEGANL